jgi:SET domain-containing protein
LTSSKNKNCEFHLLNGICVVKTTRKITKGEEILVCYTPAYWLSKEQNKIFEDICKYDTNYGSCLKKILLPQI